MKYCSSCGKPMEDNAAFCGACGAAAEVFVTPTVSPAPAAATQPRRNVKSMVFSIIGLVLGGLSLFWALLCLFVCWLPVMGIAYPVAGFVYAVPGIIFANLSKADADRGRAKAGKIMNLVAMIAFGVTFLIGIIALAGAGAGGAEAFLDGFFEVFEDMFDF